MTPRLTMFDVPRVPEGFTVCPLLPESLSEFPHDWTLSKPVLL